MPSSAVRTFTDPDDYTASIRATEAEFTLTARGEFNAKLLRIDLHHLWMQRFSDNLPRIAHSADMTGRAIVSFRTQPGPSLLTGGVEMQPSNIIRHSEAQDYYQRSAGDACFGAMSLPVEAMASLGATAGCDLTPPRDALSVAPRPLAMARLLRLHAAAGRLAEETPDLIAHPEAARGLEQSLIHAMADCLGLRDAEEGTAAERRHQAIMRRFHAALEANPDRALHVSELCAMVGASHRTLERCCYEHLGIGPKRFLLLRRMHLARRALRQADGSATTVTAIATQFGFWELGRFAVAYKSCFGESPSLTLRHPPEYRPEAVAGFPCILAEIA